MKINVDLSLDLITSGLGRTDPIGPLRFKRSTMGTLEVQFSRAGLAEELQADAIGAFELKLPGHYDADPLVSGGEWAQTGAGASTLYTFTFSFVNAALDAAFVVDGNPANDVAELTLMAELQWITARFRHKSQTLEVIVQNDIVRE